MNYNFYNYIKINYAESNIFKKYYTNNKHLKNLIYSDKNIKNEISKNPEYCNLKRHLDNFEEFITSSNAPYGLHRPRDIKFFENPKIIFKGMFSTNEFVYDESNLYVGMSCILIIEKNNVGNNLKYLLGILNSKFALNWFFQNGKKRGGGVDIGVDKLRTFPVINTSNQGKIQKIVDEIIQLTNSKDYISNNQKQQAVKEYENQIDILVYKLYDLTYDEVLVIDKDFPLSEEEYCKIQL